MTDPDVPIRDAATIVLLRRAPGNDETQILMGQRGAKAVFMPDKFVFPGGRVDDEDATHVVHCPVTPDTRARLRHDAAEHMPDALAIAAIRELWEETGLILGTQSDVSGPVAPPQDWAAFYDHGVVPACDRLRFFFRAVTPPGRPRRFDARFFLADAGAIFGDLDDFSTASGELQHLQWLSLDAARDLPMPFVTELVLGEVAARIAAPDAPRPIPYFRHGASGGKFEMIP